MIRVGEVRSRNSRKLYVDTRYPELMHELNGHKDRAPHTSFEGKLCNFAYLCCFPQLVVPHGPLLSSVHVFLGGSICKSVIALVGNSLYENSSIQRRGAWASWSLVSRLRLNCCSLANRMTSTSCDVLLWHLVEVYLVGHKSRAICHFPTFANS